MAYRLTGDRSDAEDLTQEAFFRAFRSFAEFEGDRSFENWIFRILTRLFLDSLRNRRRRVTVMSYDAQFQHAGEECLCLEFADQRPNPEERVLEGAYSEDLDVVLSSLNPDQLTLVTLADLEGTPYKDIANRLGRPVGTIRSRLHRTHKLMRQGLEQARKDRLSGEAARAKELCRQQSLAEQMLVHNVSVHPAQAPALTGTEGTAKSTRRALRGCGQRLVEEKSRPRLEALERIRIGTRGSERGMYGPTRIGGRSARSEAAQ